MSTPTEAVRAAVDLLVVAKTAQMMALQVELTTLRALPLDESADTALALYCALSGAKAVVTLADALGWRLPGAKGPRRWKPEDVYSLVTEDNPPAAPVLRAMARERLARRQTARPFAGWST
jgi:hypothetical protein